MGTRNVISLALARKSSLQTSKSSLLCSPILLQISSAIFWNQSMLVTVSLRRDYLGTDLKSAQQCAPSCLILYKTCPQTFKNHRDLLSIPTNCRRRHGGSSIELFTDKQPIPMKMFTAGRLIAALYLKLVATSARKSLYVSNYGGTVSHLSLEETAGVYSITLLTETQDCGYNPAWMELDKSRNTLMCLNEAYVGLEHSHEYIS